MDMNKKGQTLILKICLAIIVLIMIVIFYPAVNESVTNAQNTTSNLNCSDSSNDAVTTGTCIILDMGLFYFISVGIAIGLAFLTGRKTITGVLSAIFTTILVIVLITPLKELITLMRDSDHLYCASTALSVGQRMLCIFVDIWLFYFVAASIAAAITYVTLKEFVPEQQ